MLDGDAPVPMTDLDAESADFVARLLAERGVELGPHPERMSEAFAEGRIREKIERFPRERQRAGLWAVDRALRERQVPGALRLHLVTAVAHLSRHADEERPSRLEEAGR